jgi:hypothetical protein
VLLLQQPLPLSIKDSVSAVNASNSALIFATNSCFIKLSTQIEFWERYPSNIMLKITKLQNLFSILTYLSKLYLLI